MFQVILRDTSRIWAYPLIVCIWSIPTLMHDLVAESVDSFWLLHGQTAPTFERLAEYIKFHKFSNVRLAKDSSRTSTIVWRFFSLSIDVRPANDSLYFLVARFLRLFDNFSFCEYFLFSDFRDRLQQFFSASELVKCTALLREAEFGHILFWTSTSFGIGTVGRRTGGRPHFQREKFSYE